MAKGGEVFDPRGLLATFDRNIVEYVVIGGFARVIRGTDELTNGVDICPSLRGVNPRGIRDALVELDAVGVDGKPVVFDETKLAEGHVLEIRTSLGEMKIIPEPAGTRNGFDDLRRGATREHIGSGLRPRVASVADLARMAAALGREQDIVRSRELRRVMEIEVGLQRGLFRGMER
jgi:hypothetical protein